MMGTHPGHQVVARSPSTHNRDGNTEIYVIEADGSGPTRLTSNPAFDAYPAWSPAVFPKVPTGLQKNTPDSDPTPTFQWQATRSTQSYEVRINAGEWKNVGNVTTHTEFKAIAEGAHTFQVRAIAVTGFAGSPATLELDLILLAEDVNVDGEVDVGDLIMVAAGIVPRSPGHPRADVNGDEVVDILDLVAVAIKLR